MTRILTIAQIVWLEVIRRKDVYVLLVLLGCLLAALVSLNIFGLGGIVAYVLHIGLLMTWVFAWILTVNVGARELPQEETRGTIFALLSKPVSRIELVLGKWLGAWSVATGTLLVFYAMVMAVVLARGGYTNPVALAQGFFLHSVALGVVTALAIAFSTRMNHDAAASLSYVLTAASFLLVPRIPSFLTLENGFRTNVLLTLYHLLPHFEVFDMRRRISFNYGPVSWNTFSKATGYGVALTVFLLTLAWLSYRQKRFSRDAAAKG